jgi:DNA-binding Lrp family transcriptional regulator
MFTPDQTDWKVIALLNQDGRMTSAEISRRLGDVSARTVTNRIDILIEHVGYGVLADVFIEVEPGTLRTVADHLVKLPQISYLACATGDTDIIISVRASCIEELYNFVIEVVGKVSGVRRTQTYLLPIKIKDIDTWLPPHNFEKENKKSEDPRDTRGE